MCSGRHISASPSARKIRPTRRQFISDGFKEFPGEDRLVFVQRGCIAGLMDHGTQRSLFEGQSIFHFQLWQRRIVLCGHCRDVKLGCFTVHGDCQPAVDFQQNRVAGESPQGFTEQPCMNDKFSGVMGVHWKIGLNILDANTV